MDKKKNNFRLYVYSNKKASIVTHEFDKKKQKNLSTPFKFLYKTFRNFASQRQCFLLTA